MYHNSEIRCHYEDETLVSVPVFGRSRFLENYTGDQIVEQGYHGNQAV